MSNRATNETNGPKRICVNSTSLAQGNGKLSGNQCISAEGSINQIRCIEHFLIHNRSTGRKYYTICAGFLSTDELGFLFYLITKLKATPSSQLLKRNTFRMFDKRQKKRSRKRKKGFYLFQRGHESIFGVGF